MNPAFYYDIEYPADITPGQLYPVIFTLHGKGSNERDLVRVVKPLSSFIRIHIRGHMQVGGGYQFYELKSLGNPVRDMFDSVISRLQEFIAYATEKYPLDPKRRYLLGFSQGAILSMSLSLTMGDALKGIVALSGYVPAFVKSEYDIKPVKDVAYFISHGEFDPLFPIRIGHETAEYFQSMSPQTTFRIYPSDHSISEQNHRDLIDWLIQDANS